MALSVTLTAIRRQAGTGRVYVRFSDKSGMEFSDAATFREFVKGLDDDDPAAREFLKRLALRYVAARTADAGLNSVGPVTVTIDLAAAAAADLLKVT